LDRDIGLALGQREQARHGDELDFQTRIGLREERQSRRQEGRTETIRRADPDRAGERHIGAADIALDRQRLGLHALGLGEEPLAMGGQRVALGAALEELGLQRLLQRGDAARDGGVIGAEPARCGGQAARARHGQKEAEVVPVEALQGSLPYLCLRTACVSHSL